jgi:hypothetical protein
VVLGGSSLDAQCTSWEPSYSRTCSMRCAERKLYKIVYVYTGEGIPGWDRFMNEHLNFLFSLHRGLCLVNVLPACVKVNWA